MTPAVFSRARTLRPQSQTPRRARRGLSALTFVLFLSSILAIVAAIWQIDIARARIEGEVRHLGEVVASEGYGLHHWLHANPPTNSACGSTDPTPCGRALSSTEQTQLAAAATIAPWSRGAENSRRVVLARGWEIDHLVANTGDGLADGVIVLRPDTTNCLRNVPPGDQIPTWKGTRAALDNALGTGSDSAVTVAADALGTSFEPACDSAVIASHFARIDTQALLREPHAGHPVLPMATDLDLDGFQILNVEHLSTDNATIPTITPLLPDPPLPTPEPLRADSLTSPGEMTVEGDVAAQNLTLSQSASAQIEGATTIAGSLRVGIDTVTGFSANTGVVTVQGQSTVSELIACTDPEADLCGGGDLNMSVIADAQTLDNVRVFGITTVDPQATETSSVTTARAPTGVIDVIEHPNLRVNGCFRSVNPFVYGARC